MFGSVSAEQEVVLDDSPTVEDGTFSRAESLSNLVTVGHDPLPRSFAFWCAISSTNSRGKLRTMQGSCSFHLFFSPIITAISLSTLVSSFDLEDRKIAGNENE